MKKSLGVVNALYPLPTVLLGTYVNGRANFIAIAHIGVLTRGEPECLSFGVNRSHYSNQGIKEAKAFSVNLPGENLVAETDYCGIVSGRDTDKSQVFQVGRCAKVNAPYIEECPVVMECELYDLMEFPRHDIFIGRIVETRAEESVLSDGEVDVAKVKPLFFDMASKRYWSLGRDLAGCWNAGLALKRKLQPGD